jgi:hypothetical protein
MPPKTNPTAKKIRAGTIETARTAVEALRCLLAKQG